MDKDLIIKVCGMRQLENIQAVSALGTDWMGFIHFPKSKRHITLGDLKITLATVPKNIKKVGVVVNESIETIVELVALGIDYIQLHGKESPEVCQNVGTFTKVIKAFSVSNSFDFEVTKPYEGTCDYFLFDAKGRYRGGNGIQYDWDILKEYTGDTPFLLSGGIGAADAERIKAFQHTKCVGIDVNSGFEIEPALKDITLLKTFVKKLKKL